MHSALKNADFASYCYVHDSSLRDSLLNCLKPFGITLSIWLSLIDLWFICSPRMMIMSVFKRLSYYIA